MSNETHHLDVQNSLHLRQTALLKEAEELMQISKELAIIDATSAHNIRNSLKLICNSNLLVFGLINLEL